MHSPTDHLLRINVYRPLDGLRAPYTITLDRMRNVISDLLDEKELERIKSTPHLLARHTIGDAGVIPTPIRTAEQVGLYRHVTERGIVLSKEPLDEWGQEFVKWQDAASPNPFPESQDLRLEYFTERDDIEKRIAEGNCPGCELNRLQVDYRIKLRKLQGL